MDHKRTPIKGACFLTFISTFMLQSCVLHPPYIPPRMEIPEEWRFAQNDERIHEDEGTIEECIDINELWWQKFNDPVLSDLIKEAITYNQEIKTAICRVEEFYARLGIARSRLYPQIFGNATAMKQEASLAGVDEAAIPQNTPTTVKASTAPPAATDAAASAPGFKRITDFFSINVTLSYELDIWGRIYSATEAARAELFAQIDVRRGVVLTIVTSVAQAYVQLREFDQELRIAKETRKSYIESFRLAKLRFEEGFTSELEVKQAESQIFLAEARVVRTELLIAEQENLISILVGHPPTAIQRGLAITEWPEPFNIPVGLPADLLFQRPDIKQAEQILIAANARIGVARADYFPTISLTGLFGYESLELKNLLKSTSRTWQYGANVTQPIFTGWLITNNVAAAEAVHCEAYYAYETAVLNGFKEMEDALITHRKSKELYHVQKGRVAVLKELLKLANLQYANGQTDYLNVLDAERNLFDAELDMASAQGEIFVSLIAIYKALGGGWVDVADCEALSNETDESTTKGRQWQWQWETCN